MSAPEASQASPPNAAASPAGSEREVPLRLCILEREEVVFMYPEKDALLTTLAPLLHNIHVHAKVLSGDYTETATFQRGGMKLRAISRRVPNAKDTFICALWTVGELSGGQVPSSIKVANARDSGHTFLTVQGTAMIMGNDQTKGARVARIMLDSERMVLSIPDLSVDLRVDVATAAKVQRLADTLGSVKHNIRMRAPWQTRETVLSQTQSILASLLFLWPSVRDAKEAGALPAFLDDISRHAAGSFQKAIPTKPFPAHITERAVESLYQMEDLLQVHSREARGCPTYVRMGEFVTFNGDVVVSSLPPQLTHVALHYLRSIGYEAAMANTEDVFADTVMLGSEGSPVKGLLLLYRREGVEVVSVSSPSLQARCGATQVQIFECMRKTAAHLLDKHRGILAPGVTTAVPMLAGVHKYHVTLSQGNVVASNEDHDTFAVRCFDSMLPIIRQQLAFCREVCVTVSSPKSREGYKMKGWRPDNAEDDVVVICDADAQPVLSSLYCQVLASVSL